jgi:hypothetical protein
MVRSGARPTWFERWRIPLGSPRWLRILLLVAVVLLYPLCRRILFLLTREGPAADLTLGPFEPELAASGLGLAAAQDLANQAAYFASPLAIGFLACLIAVPAASLLPGLAAAKARTRSALTLGFAIVAALALGGLSGGLLARVAGPGKDTPVFALLCVLATILWLLLLWLLRLARLPYPLPVLLFAHLLSAWQLRTTIQLQILRAGVASPLECAAAVLFDSPFWIALGLGVALLILLRRASSSAEEPDSARIDCVSAPLLASIVLTASAAIVLLSIPVLVLQAGGDSHVSATRAATAFPIFVFVADALGKLVLTAASALIGLIALTPGTPSDRPSEAL